MPGAFGVCFGFVGVSCFVLDWVFLLLVGLVLGFLAGGGGCFVLIFFYSIISPQQQKVNLDLTNAKA